MTVTYSLAVAEARFCGFAKLLARWKGSIYKILWKEFSVFCLGYTLLALTYRCFLNVPERAVFEKVVLFVDTLTDLIPLSFVLGFYVSLVIGRWWAQYDAIPWPDRLCLMIASYVHGADERSRMIRRTLGRYLILLQILTFQAVSTSVKRRFPTTQHLVSAGVMTKEEQSVYDKITFVYGKWWVPCQWFCSLLMRAKKEGRIKDSILLDALFRELLNYRNSCGTMLSYDWISVPLVYTQVVTLATYMYAGALMIGRQYLDPTKGYDKHKVDLYVPFFTIMQFFFYVGWLKVAEQIVNPYGEDDDDFELNWCVDRTLEVVYLIVDHLQTKHPKVRKDSFWDELEPKLPQTKHSAKAIENPQLGSAFNLEVADAEYLPMDTFLEQDTEDNIYKGDSIRRRSSIGFRSSFLVKLFNPGLRQSKKSIHKNDTIKSSFRLAPGSNPESTPVISRKSSSRSFIRKPSPSQSRTSSISFRPDSLNLRRFKSFDTQELNGTASDFDHLPTATESGQQKSISSGQQQEEASINEDHDEADLGVGSRLESHIMPPIPEEPSRTSLVSVGSRDSMNNQEKCSGVQNLVREANEDMNRHDEADLGVGSRLETHSMPPIPEEPSRTSLVSVESRDSSNNNQESSDGAQNLVREANDVLKELNRTISAQDRELEAHIMPPIPEESSRTSLVSVDSSNNQESCSDVQNLVREANEVLRELNKTISGQEDRELSRGYESCCSFSSDNSSEEEESNRDTSEALHDVKSNVVVVVVQDGVSENTME